MKLRYALLAAPLALGLAAGPAAAALVMPTSYSMPNGGTGSYNYWDDSYNGAGNNTANYAFLSGGTGDLTDGVVAGEPWNVVEAPSGPGPYVGWYDVNPLITFSFAGAPVIETIRIHIDNTLSGGVRAPSAILIDGNAVSFSMPAEGTFGWAEATGLNLTGSSHTVQLVRTAGSWVFTSEMQFLDNQTAVPEPASWAMMIGGLGIVGAALRRRKARIAFA